MPELYLTPPPGRLYVMGILNLTPDSFSDGGRFSGVETALEEARRQLAAGADILDIGGESSRPGAAPVGVQEEIDRTAPVVERLAIETDKPISIDTVKPEAARECLRLGARIVNDISGLANEAMRRVCAEYGASVVIMHMRGTPRTMQDDTRYEDLVTEVRDLLREQVEAATAAGVKEIAIDPGIGFGKTAEQNFELIRRLGELGTVERPVLVGPSRKSFLGSLPSRLETNERLEGTIAACVAAALNGARILRVHDPGPVRRAMEATEAILGEPPWTAS